jgi:hypothetical protein
VFTCGTENGGVHRRWHKHTSRRWFLEGSHQFRWGFRLLTVAACVWGTVIHVHLIKCARWGKGSRREKFFCAFITSQGFQGVMQTRLHSAERDVDGCGDFPECEVVHETQE